MPIRRWVAFFTGICDVKNDVNVMLAAGIEEAKSLVARLFLTPKPY
jgi:hypothetical protein